MDPPRMMLISGCILATIGGICLAGPPTRRKDIESMTPEELLSYREYVQEALDNGSFDTVAGWHGMPLMSSPEVTGFCVHGTPAFLMWYRFYLTVMEMVIGCPIPYWNWQKSSIPKAFSDTFYTSRNGSTLLNPLHSVFLPVDLRTVDNPGPTTQRNPESPFPYGDIVEKENYALYALSDFNNFSAALEDCQNLAQVSLGGILAYVDVASFDPMFWSLQMNTERIFFQWQLMHDDLVYPSDVAEMPIELNSYTAPAADLLTYFDGWMQGAPPGEIERWKQSLKAALAKRDRNSNFTVLEDSDSLAPPSASTTDPITTPAPSTGTSETSPSQAAYHLVAGLSPAAAAVLALLEPASSTSAPDSSPALATTADTLSAAPLTNAGPMPTPSSYKSAMLAYPSAMPLEPIQHIQSPFSVADIGAGHSRNHVMITIRQVPSTPQPCILLTVLGGRIVARTGMLAMGPSPMSAYVMERPVDISRAYEKLGYKASGTVPESLSQFLEFRMKDVRTGVETPHTPPEISIDAIHF